MPGGYSHLSKMAITKCATTLPLSSLVTSPELAKSWSPGQNDSKQCYPTDLYINMDHFLGECGDYLWEESPLRTSRGGAPW